MAQGILASAQVKRAIELIKRITKRWAKIAFKDYGVYRIYALSKQEVGESAAGGGSPKCRPVNRDALESSVDDLIREQAWYCGEESSVYAYLNGDRIVGVCCFWFGNRYRQRNFWPLADDEAKLVQVITLPEMRGRGVASKLIQHAAQDMFQRRFRQLYARVWHSNIPSLRAFEHAGWRHIATVIEWVPIYGKRKRRFVRAPKR